MIQRAMAGGRLLSIACLAHVAGCGDDPATTTAVVFDSAGITIAASPADVLSDLRLWRLAEPPRIVIGNRAEDRDHPFSHVVGAALLSDGTILVGDAGSGELRLFDAAGRVLRRFEDEDDGPVEPRLLSAIAVLPGDTIVSSVSPQGRVSRFTAGGVPLGSARLGQSRPALVTEILPDGSILFDLYDRGYEADVETWAVSGTSPLFRPRGWLVRAFPDGRRHTLREIRGPQWFKTGEPGRVLWYAPRPFSATSVVAVAGSRIYFGDPERAEIEVLSLGGELRGLVRWEEEAVPVTDADRVRARETALASLREPERRVQLEAWLDDVPFPAYKPAFSRLFADRAGRLWIQVPARAGARDDRWIVFDVDGHSLASLEPPAGSRFLDAGEDFALLVSKDSGDRVLVKLYRLEK